MRGDNALHTDARSGAMTYDTDLLIAGGGPGGLATALHARQQGLSVIVAEPRNDPIDKACGEGLMPGGLAELASLGVDPAGMPLRGIAYLDEQSSRRGAFPQRPGARRSTHHAARRAGLTRQRARHRMDLDARRPVSSRMPTASRPAGVRAKWLVAADGLHSAVRRAVGIDAVAGTPRRYGRALALPGAGVVGVRRGVLVALG